MLKRSTESAKASAPEIEMVPQELFWNYGRFIRRQDNDAMKRRWSWAQHIALSIMLAVIAFCWIAEAVKF